jgi:hypothetical protein
MATGRVPTTANSPLTAKGDLFGYSTTQARVPVGNDGETIVADSSTSTGLRYQGNYAAGKNAIINGAFDVWQRGTSISLTNNTTAYTCDRFYIYTSFSAGTSSVSRQTFTPGTAPVAGYEGQYFARYTAGSTVTYFEFGQRIENVQTFAGQTATVSFWAKASANTTVSGTLVQNFGSGGSSAVSTGAGSYSVTTSWTRFTATVSVPSISGKTIGAGNYLNFVFASSSLTGSQTIDFWGVQVEAGSVATAFQTATGTIQGELAACQRYYEAITILAQRNVMAAQSTSSAFGALYYKVTKRGTPTVTLPASGSGAGQIAVLNTSGSYPATIGTVAADQITVDSCTIKVTGATSAYAAGDALVLYTNGAATIAVGAEL